MPENDYEQESSDSSKDGEAFRCGYVAIVGRPNVGKSTLLNKFLGQKISITAHKPQTTRHRVLGIKSLYNAQIIFVDTPGIHIENKSALNRYMNRAATSSIVDVDVVLFMVDELKWLKEDEYVLKKLLQTKAPVILVINKLDTVKNKEKLLPHIETLSGQFSFRQIIPISAKNGDGLDVLEKAILDLLPESPPFFPLDQVTDRSLRFMAAEFIREKLMRSLGEEIPYALTVEIEKFEELENLTKIHAVIWVSRDSQKGIIIGKQGKQLKSIGEQARKDMEKAFDSKVYLQLWVKVKEGWSDDERALRTLGYQDEQ